MDSRRNRGAVPISHRCAGERARRVGQYLLQKNLSAERPLVVLSGNDIEHALLHLGAMYVGIPYAPVSPAYSLLSTDFGKLRAIFQLLTPGLVFASQRDAFKKAIDALKHEVATVRTGRAAPSLAAAEEAAAAEKPAAAEPELDAESVFARLKTRKTEEE